MTTEPRRGAPVTDPSADGDDLSAYSLPDDPGAVMTPQYWETMEKRIPRTLRKEFAPVARKAKEIAEYEARRPAIEAAHDTLEKYRGKYERLCNKPAKLLARAEKLFAEPPFETVHFSADDLQKAFEAVGYPPTNRAGVAYAEVAKKATDVLVDDKQRDALARRLMYLLPDYVAEGRYLDAWILQHSAILLNEPPEDGCGLFLLCMFIQGLKQWDEKRDREQIDMFRSLGIDLDEMQRKGFEGVESLIQEMMKDPDKTAELEKFLESHPELKALSEAHCRESEDAAVRLLRREDAAALLLPFAEVEPWLSVFEQRICECPGVIEAMQHNSKPKEEEQKAVVDILYATGGEMAAAIFSEQRLRQLTDTIHDYRRHLSQSDHDGLDGVSGALIAAQASGPAAENHFLAVLCSTSLLNTVQAMSAETDA